MKKLIRLLICAILILSLVLSFVGCKEESSTPDSKEETVEESDNKTSSKKDEDEEEATIIGTWEGELDLSELLSAYMAEADEDMAEHFTFKSFTIDVTFEFDKKGNYELAVDEDSLDDAMQNVKKDLKKGLEKYLEASIEKEGLDMTVEELLEQGETTMDELVDSAFSEFSLEDIANSFNNEGTYLAEDGKLYTAADSDEIDENTYETYKLKGDTLTLLEYFGEGEDDEAIQSIYPIIFKRVK